MEARHKDMLITRRADLVENMNVRDGLFTQLLSRKVLNQRMVRTIKTGKTVDEQAEELLDVLAKGNENAFRLFCEALEADFQEHIVKLYLTPNDDSTTVKERQESVQETSKNNSVPGPESEKCVEKCSSVSSADGGPRDLPASSNVSQQVSIREEYQQQTFCRSIEHSEVDAVKVAGNGDPRLEQQAKYFCENLMRNPGVDQHVFHVVNGSDLAFNHAGKERLMSEKQFPSSPKKIISPYDDRYMYRNSNPSIVKDTPFIHSHSSPSLHSMQKETITEYPSSFHSSPVRLLTNSHQPQSIPFSFNCLNGSPTDSAYNRHHPLNDYDAVQSAQKLDFSERPLQRSIERDSINPMVNSRGNTVSALSASAIPEIRHSPSKHISSSYDRVRPVIAPSSHHIERDSYEMPRYIQVNTSGEAGTEGEMIAFPHHIERVRPGPHNSSLRDEEFASLGGVPRLVKNDSVDTMDKRTMPDPEEPKAKRLRETSESIPDNMSTVQFYSEVDRTVVRIPVVRDSQQRKPAMPEIVIKTDNHTERIQRGSLLGVMDDPEIDLTDGPVNVQVDLCTRQFYLTHYKQAYAMRRIPRGMALILNVNEVVGKAPRRGTDIDRDNLYNLLCQLHFDVTVFNDENGLTAKEMALKLQDFSQHPGHANADCSVICILSHGEEGYIFGADGLKFELDAVFELFDNTCCKSLRGKPKIFIIQACRGGALDKGVQYCPDEHDGSDSRVRQVPSMSDMLICYPTQMGYYAWRNRDRGSWYVEALVQVFMKFAKCEDLCAMLNRVNLLVSKKVSHCPQADMDQMSQMSEYKSTLRMPHLYLFPGIGGC